MEIPLANRCRVPRGAEGLHGRAWSPVHNSPKAAPPIAEIFKITMSRTVASQHKEYMEQSTNGRIMRLFHGTKYACKLLKK